METARYNFDGETFERRLKEAVSKKGLTNAELSRISGVSAATIGHYINGNRTPRGFGDIIPVAKALNVSVDYLAGVVDYNYLDGSPKSSIQKPENYYDIVRLINRLIDSYLLEAHISFERAGDEDECYSVNIGIIDATLYDFLQKQNKLFDMVGGALSLRAFRIALDDLHEEMRNTPFNADFDKLLEANNGKGKD